MIRGCPMAVTLTQLVAFLAVVRRGSVTAAAEELVVTQPSVSAAVAALERELGVALTERAGRTLRPTPAGAAYAPYAADVLGLLEQGARAAREAAERGRADAAHQRGHDRRRVPRCRHSSRASASTAPTSRSASTSATAPTSSSAWPTTRSTSRSPGACPRTAASWGGRSWTTSGC